jgi:SAM-dependent methyltransferase
MKLRESGMPDEAFWETLFDVELILDRLEIDRRVHDVVELGCGYGTFTLPVARRVTGQLHTFDIAADMVARTRERAKVEKITNAVCELRDVFLAGFGVPAQSQDACLLFNILHGEEPLRLLKEAARVVRSGGFVHVIHWRHDPAKPRGPNLEIRPHPEQIANWAAQTGLLFPVGSTLNLPPWHYGLRLVKSSIQRHP